MELLASLPIVLVGLWAMFIVMGPLGFTVTMLGLVALSWALWVNTKV